MTSPLRVLFISHAYVVGVNQGKLNAIASATPSGSIASATPSGSIASATPSGSIASATPSGSIASATPSGSIASATPSGSIASATPSGSIASATPSGSIASATPSGSIAQTGKVEVGLLAPSNWKALEWNRTFEVEKPYSNIKIYTAPVLFPGRGGACIYAPWKIWQVINDFKPDVVQVEHEVFSLCAFELAIWSRLTGKPLVIFGWENMERTLPLPRRWIRQFVLNTAQLILPGNQDGGNLLRQWGYTGLMEVIPQMGVDTQLFAPKMIQKQNEVFNIGFLGRLVPEKGIDTIFSAVRQLRDKGLKCQVTICGSGSGEDALRQEAEKQQIADLIIWRGVVRHEQAPTEISNFDALVLPSRTTVTWKEQFGHVLIEAMAMGVPVIGSDSGEIPNVIGRSDLVFGEGDSQALTAILERMICKPSWWEEVGKYGIDRVEKYYTHEKIAEKLIKLWKTILENTNQKYVANYINIKS